MSHAIIPAQSGWSLLYPSIYEDGDIPQVHELEPIIAWRVEDKPCLNGVALYSQAVPITADCEASDYMIVRPDGVVIDQGIQTFRCVKDAAEWIRHNRAKGQ